MKKIYHCRSAFSLTELVIALAIMSILSAGILKATIILGKSFAETRNMSTTQLETERFVQNFKILLYNAFEAEFRRGGGNTNNALFSLASNPNPENDTVFLSMIKKPNPSRFTNWSKIVFQNNNLYWVNQIASTDTTASAPSTEKWQLLMPNVYRSDDINAANLSSASDPIFRFIYTDPKTSTGIAGVYIRCRIRLRSTAMNQTPQTLLFETAVRFANL